MIASTHALQKPFGDALRPHGRCMWDVCVCARMEGRRGWTFQEPIALALAGRSGSGAKEHSGGRLSRPLRKCGLWQPVARDKGGGFSRSLRGRGCARCGVCGRVDALRAFRVVGLGFRAAPCAALRWAGGHRGGPPQADPMWLGTSTEGPFCRCGVALHEHGESGELGLMRARV